MFCVELQYRSTVCSLPTYVQWVPYDSHMLHDRSHMYYLLRSRCSRAQTRGGRSVHIDIVAVCCTLDAHWAGAVVHASHTPVCTHIRTHTPPRAHAHTPIHTHIQIIGYRAAKHCDIRNKAYNNDFFYAFTTTPLGLLNWYTTRLYIYA